MNLNTSTGTAQIVNMAYVAKFAAKEVTLVVKVATRRTTTPVEVLDFLAEMNTVI